MQATFHRKTLTKRLSLQKKEEINNDNRITCRVNSYDGPRPFAE